ncbi:Tumor necrosis factor receptor superfamily member 26 [Phytophthora citrophthora]|uniref:Tumor necrosis factor receptor superfamily member 26 n=1 Tax=Phytophthora citrophthora TaxID=4793 RepID=A0AAD9LVA7_9STRA|nr:Tumor necrosis factor receptor superfamily member 26 [Phytophthora citrophthora]
MEILRRGQNVWLTLLELLLVVFNTLGGVTIAANGRFQFTQAVYSTTEDFGVAYITVQRSLGFNGRAAVYVSSIPGVGNAVAGRDFKPIFNVSLVWQDGEDFEKELYVPIYNDGKPQETAKTFTLKLHDAVGADINLDRNQTQIILVPPSNLLPGSFSFAKDTMSITEGNSLTVPVVWVAGTTSTASVRFDVACKSACSPDDFVVVSPTTKLLEWKRDDFPVNSISRTQNIVLEVLVDKLYEQTESFSLRLIALDTEEGDSIGTGVLGDIAETVITIAGPNDMQSGTLQFEADCFPDCASTKYSVISGGTAVVLVQRRRGSDGDCSVTVATQDGTALAGVDYQPLEQSLSWKEGDTSDRQILVRSISRPDPRLPTRRVALVLKNNKGAQMNGVHASTTYVDITSLTDVFLGDVNFATREPLESVLKPPELGLILLASRNTSSRLQLCPSVGTTQSGVLSVAIQRNFADFLVPVRVVITTVAGTATPSVDYEPVDTVISWANNDAEVKHVLVRILTPPTFDPRPRSFWLQLSDVTGAIVGDCNLLEVVLTGIAPGPHISSFELDMALGTLTLQLSASVQASTLDVSKLLLQSERELKNGPTFKFNPQQTTTNSLDGTTIVLNIGAGDFNALKRVVGLAQSVSTTFVSVGGGLFQYILNNCQSSGILACSPAKTIATPSTSALVVSKFTADTIAPTLLGFSMDLPRRLLKLHFSEAVDFASLKIEALGFSESAAGMDVYRLSSSTTRLFSPQPDPLSGATLRDLNRLPADYTFLTLQLGRADSTSLASFGTGKIGIARANTFLGMGSAFVADFAGNPVLAVSSPALRQVSAADCSTCPTGSYLTSSCSDLKDRKCATCSVCPGNSYALEACRSTQDTLCYPCTECRSGQFVSIACSPTTDRVCAPCTQCTLDEYEVSTCATGADRVCRTCNSCALTTAQQWLCQRSPMWKRLQMRLPFSCPQSGQQFKTREEQLQKAKSNKCGSGRCSCVATSIAGNANPNGDGFPTDSRCTGPVAYNILV